MNYTYIVECKDGTYYTGWTTDLKRRLKAHNNGTGAKYTRSRAPVHLIYFEEHDTKEEAMRREYAIKQMTRAKKKLLIQNMEEEQCTMYQTELRDADIMNAQSVESDS